MTKTDILKNILKQRNSRITILLTIVFSVLFNFASFKLVLPSFEEQIMLNIIDESTRVSKHLISVYDENNNDFKHMNKMKEDLHLEKIKFFDKNGKILYSTSKKDIGTINKNDYYHNIVANGEVFYKIVKKGKKTLEGRTIEVDVAEVYIPIMKDNKFKYAFEVYYDITWKIKVFDKLIFRIKVISYIIILMLFIIIFIMLYSTSKERLKEKLLQEQLLKSEKMASMGEMIGNIAHQWRQPLSAITSTASAVKISNELSILEEGEINSKMDKIIDKANYLSDTINTFRDFLDEDKERKKFDIENLIKKSLKILEDTLEDLHIRFINKINYSNKTYIVGVESELSQVIINIINNAKDILIEKNIENPLIELDTIVKNNKIIITIEDNGGGIPEDIIPKIFDPYFTTKHQSQGTGLGLHMSYEIITNSLKGDLYVKNTDIGAKFFIELPFN